MANNLESIEILPGDNGGHRVLHNFKREAGQEGPRDAQPFEDTDQCVYTKPAQPCGDSWHPRTEF